MAEPASAPADDSLLELTPIAPGPIERPSNAATESLDAGGAVWRRIWSLPDRLVVEFVGVAVAEVLDRDGSVRLDRPLAPPLRRHLQCDHLLPLFLARRGNLVLHAGLISHEGAAVALLGASGAGKSTLVARCGQQGWTIGGDDGVVVDLGPPCTARPTHRGLRLTPASLDLLELDPTSGAESAGKLDVPLPADGRDLEKSLRLSAVVALEPAPDGTDVALTPLTGVAAHAALFRGAFQPDAASLQRVVHQLASVVEAVPVRRLVLPRGRDALTVAERALRRLLPEKV